MTFSLSILLPLAALILLAVFVPLGLFRLLPHRLPMMLVNLALAALALYLLGALLLAALDLLAAPGLAASLATNPPGALLWLARKGVVPVVAWLPFLALTELVLAQRIAGEGPK